MRERLSALVLLFFISIQANDPLKCAASSNDTSTSWFCGSDGNSYRIKKDLTLPPNVCFYSEGVVFNHAGTCECPNGCYTTTGNGACGSEACICEPGFSGPDCSIMECGQGRNPCQHGSCVIDAQNTSYCQCNIGWTSSDCSVPTAHDFGGYLPYGNLFPNDRPYWSHDKYGDEHPIFNLSVVASIRVKVNEADWIKMIQPENLPQPKNMAKGSMIFDNGQVRFHDGVHLKFKGQSTRISFLRGYTLEFADDHLGIRSLDMKAFDTTCLKNLLSTDVYRSCNIPSPRSSFATLWINDIQMGTFWMSERMDATFVERRYLESNGSFVKCDLRLFDDGTNPETYAKNSLYQMISGNNWTSFMQLAHSKQLQIQPFTKINFTGCWYIDQDRIIRVLAGDAITSNWDGFAIGGHNFFVFDNIETNFFEMMPHDFDLNFDLDWVASHVDAYLSVQALRVNPKDKDIAHAYVKMMSQKILTSDILTRRVQNLSAMLAEEFQKNVVFQVENRILWNESIGVYVAQVDTISKYATQRAQFISQDISLSNPIERK